MFVKLFPYHSAFNGKRKSNLVNLFQAPLRTNLDMSNYYPLCGYSGFHHLWRLWDSNSQPFARDSDFERGRKRGEEEVIEGGEKEKEKENRLLRKRTRTLRR